MMKPQLTPTKEGATTIVEHERDNLLLKIKRLQRKSLKVRQRSEAANRLVKDLIEENYYLRKDRDRKANDLTLYEKLYKDIDAKYSTVMHDLLEYQAHKEGKGKKKRPKFDISFLT